MTDDIIIEYKDDYIHVKQFGRDNYDISLNLWRRIVAACKEYNCFNILGESTTIEELSTNAAHKHIEIFKLAGVTLQHRIAWVHHGENSAKNTNFIENSLKNRFLLNGGFFNNPEEAREWLLSESDG